MFYTLSTIFRKIAGCLTAGLLMPFYGLFQLLSWSAGEMESFLISCKDFCRSLTDPNYIPPIGLGGFHARNACMQKALEAEENGETEEEREACLRESRQRYALAASFGKEADNKISTPLTEKETRCSRQRLILGKGKTSVPAGLRTIPVLHGSQSEGGSRKAVYSVI